MNTNNFVLSFSQQFDRYFAANDVSKGGSFYLQSKIYRAQELLMEFQKDKRREEQEQASKQSEPPKDSKE